jgi:hypothetical protein
VIPCPITPSVTPILLSLPGSETPPCFTALNTEKYGLYDTESVLLRVFDDSLGQVPFDGDNLYYQNDETGCTSIQIDNDGFVTDGGSNCC